MDGKSKPLTASAFLIELNGKSYVLLVMCSVLVSLVVWVLCTFLLGGFGFMMSFSGRAMFWFTHTFNIFFMFIIPSMTAILRLHQYLKDYFWKVICINISTRLPVYIFLLVIFTVNNSVHIIKNLNDRLVIHYGTFLLNQKNYENSSVILFYY